jgi:hypothetical protein
MDPFTEYVFSRVCGMLVIVIRRGTFWLAIIALPVNLCNGTFKSLVKVI